MTTEDAADPIGRAARALAAAGVESPRLEAQLLLALALDTTRAAITAGLYDLSSGADRARFEELVAARCRRVPLAYLRGTQEFYGLEFEVGPAVLIPRPETELLVDFAREKLGESRSVLADVGTGSGCIAVAALTQCPRARGVAFDLSAPALEIAQRNAARNSVAGRLRFVQADLLCGAAGGRFDLVLSNPPYIPSDEVKGLQPEVRDAEPRIALDGGPDGLAVYRLLAPMARHCLVRGGWLAVEVGQWQAALVIRMFTGWGLSTVEIRRDLAGIERLVAGQRVDS